jgi:hypothetical protein
MEEIDSAVVSLCSALHTRLRQLSRASEAETADSGPAVSGCSAAGAVPGDAVSADRFDDSGVRVAVASVATSPAGRWLALSILVTDSVL